MTQTSHVQAACHDATVEDDCWTARQIAHSYDYSVARPRERAVVAALTAGLNMQSLHHALPTIAQSRLPELYDEHSRRADTSLMNRGDAAAATWIFRGDESHASGMQKSPRGTAPRRGRPRTC